MIKIIYITGFAHNGSTLLDSILGNHSDVLSAGEIIHFPYGLTDDSGHRCGCGRLARECPVWREVVPRWMDRTGQTSLDSYKHLVNKFARRRNRAWMVRGSKNHSRDFELFARDSVALFRLLSEISGRTAIIDSSKSAPRGLALSLIPEIDFRVVHLVRDVRGTAWSFLKRKKWARSVLAQLGLSTAFSMRVALGWTLANQSADQLLETVGEEQSVRIRYEDLIAEPAAVVQRIYSVCGVKLDAIPELRWRDEIPNKGHLMWGNDIRTRRSFKLGLDTSWEESLSKFDQQAVMALSGRMMRRYGYEGG